MRKALLFWLFVYLFNFVCIAQAPPCGTNDPPGNTCLTATPICNLDGYCGRTDASYTVDTWGQMGTPIGCGSPFPIQPCPGSGLTGAFCSGIQNNSFLSFVASEPNISFDVWVYNSQTGEGIQIMIFKPDGNCSGDVTSYFCNEQMLPSPNPQNVSASGLIVGETYYIMIDGYSGDVADYTFSANTGIATPLNLSVGNAVTICTGESITVTATGGDENYTWDPSPDLSSTTGATVTITPPATPGSYTYTVTSGGGGTSLCPSNNSITLTVTVESCQTGGCSVTASNDNPSFCENTISTINLTATGTAGGTYSWTGPNNFTSSSQNPTNVPVPSSAGTYTYNVSLNANGETCTAATSIVIGSSPDADAGNTVQITCEDPSVQLNGSSSTSGVTYSWSGPGIISGETTATPSVNQSGTYTLTVTDPSSGCSSTSTVEVTDGAGSFSISAGPDQTITCASPTVQLNGSSTSPTVNFSWSGPGIVSGETTATPTVNLPGTYTLVATDPVSGCTRTASVVVSGSTGVPDSEFIADTLTGCEGVTINFVALTSNSSWDYQWSFGNGSTGNGSSTSHQYNQSGCYAVTLTVTDITNNCENSTTLADSICIIQRPVASFTADPQILDPNNGISVVQFSNNSTGADQFVWVFENGSQQNTENASFDFKDYAPGNYPVYLIASNQNLCFDSTVVIIRIENEIIYYIPNTFTPDGDEFNQSFRPIITSGIDIHSFLFQIYNRWGELIWESRDSSIGWDGTYNGVKIQEGMYIWTMSFKLIETDERVRVDGHVNLIR